MCVVFYTLSHPGYRLILASNRDEYLDRAALEAHWHNFDVTQTTAATGDILSGIDLGAAEAGTWFGITRDLRLAIITNIRDVNQSKPTTPSITKPSRGQLVKDYLMGSPTQSMQDFVDRRMKSVMQYDGFSLLLFDLKRESLVGYLSNRSSPMFQSENLAVGVRGLSNTSMQQPWPKVSKGISRMKETLSRYSDEQEILEQLMTLLRQSIPLKSLADARDCTCIPPVLIPNGTTTSQENNGRWYGTRLSTIVLVSDAGKVTFVERDITVLRNGNPDEGGSERRFTFQSS